MARIHPSRPCTALDRRRKDWLASQHDFSWSQRASQLIHHLEARTHATARIVGGAAPPLIGGIGNGKSPRSGCMEDQNVTDHFALAPHIIPLAAAYALAVPIGWNREKEERSAGLRTFPLVALASCGFVQAVEQLTADDPAAMARVLEGVIAGIGFLGGGAILQRKDSVKGTATAASLWVTGAIGVATGLASYDVAIVLAVFTMATLWIMAPLKPSENERDEAAKQD